MQQPQGSDTLFAQHWNIYQQIIAHNYMQHQALSALVNPWHSNAFGHTVISLLDIGAGDARIIARQKPRGLLCHYTGIDVSAEAIQLAEKHLQEANIPATLHCQDFMTLLPQLTNTFHVVYASFALHHVSNDDKRKVLQEICRLLQPKGQFVWIDVFAREHQSREHYLEAYQQRIQQWTALDATALQLLTHHVVRFDFPCSINEAMRWSREAGLTCTSAHMADDVHGILVLQKP